MNKVVGFRNKIKQVFKLYFTPCVKKNLNRNIEKGRDKFYVLKGKLSIFLTHLSHILLIKLFRWCFNLANLKLNRHYPILIINSKGCFMKLFYFV